MIAHTKTIAILISQISFRDWIFDLVQENDCLFLRVRFTAPNNITGKPEEHKGRKWRLSSYMTTSEVVSTAFKAVITAIEHEAREQFLYRGRAVYGPHLDVEALHGVAHRTAKRRASD